MFSIKCKKLNKIFSSCRLRYVTRLQFLTLFVIMEFFYPLGSFIRYFLLPVSIVGYLEGAAFLEGNWKTFWDADMSWINLTTRLPLCSALLSSSLVRFRQLCQSIIAHKLFDYVVLAFIFLNCITVALERPKIMQGSLVRNTVCLFLSLRSRYKHLCDVFRGCRTCSVVEKLC